jgi:hypothetical protein
LNLPETQTIQMNMINVSGQKIYSTDLRQLSGVFRKSISLKDKPNGIYYLQIITDHQVINKKMIKQE